MEAAFDSLKFYDELKAADVSDKQARAQAQALRSALASYDAGRLKELATKGDIQDVRQEIQAVRQDLGQEIQAVRQDLGQEIQSVRQDLGQEIQAIRQDLGQEIQSVRQDLGQEIQAIRQEVQTVRQDMRQEFRGIEVSILKWVIGTIITQTALIMTVIALISAFILKQI